MVIIIHLYLHSIIIIIKHKSFIARAIHSISYIRGEPGQGITERKKTFDKRLNFFLFFFSYFFVFSPPKILADYGEKYRRFVFIRARRTPGKHTDRVVTDEKYIINSISARRGNQTLVSTQKKGKKIAPTDIIFIRNPRAGV